MHGSESKIKVKLRSNEGQRGHSKNDDVINDDSPVSGDFGDVALVACGDV